jgi:hypothetical protein
LCERLAKDPILDGLAVAVQRLELSGQAVGLLRIVREEELEGGARMTQPAGSVDPRSEPKADRARIDGGGIHSAPLS